MIVYTKNDRIKVKMNDLVITLAPLTYMQKSNVQNEINKDPMSGSVLTLKYCIKGIDGLQNVDGSKYELQFENEMLTDEAIDDLTNIHGIESLYIAALNLVNGVPEYFYNPMNGNKLEGIEIVKNKKEEPNEKK